MLNRLPAYFLLLGLACQIGYAQRSGASFSILSESTGPLVADGNTTTTAFSQMGATEATQGTFSSATTGVTGTIGFLSQQSSSSVDPASSFTVSGGQSGAPYYQFIDGNGQTPDFTSLLLNPGKSYKFTASGVSNSHPFMIGESYGDMNSSLVNGGPLSGSGGSITVTMPIDFNGSLYYFCTNHSGMFQEFSIRRPTNLNPTAPLTFAENQPIGSEVGEFNATNPDANSTLTYYLVSGTGDGNNSLFTLETNGTLKTATTFDYESNASSYSIRVQAKDEYNATVEGNFTVMLLNVNEPSTGSVTVSGTPVVGQTLTASNTLADPDGLGAVTYQWYRDGVPIVLGGTLKDGVNGVDGLDGAYNVTLSADGKYAYVTGIEDDAVSWYERNASTGALIYRGVLKDEVGGVDGLDYAYNVTLSADGNHAYATGSADDAVSWYERNASTGALTYGGVLKDGVVGVDGLKGAFDVTLSADGNHLYATGSGDDAVSWYERNVSTGVLIYGGILKDGVGGVDGLKSASGVTLSADGNHAYVVGNNDDAVSWYERNTSTGTLTYGGMLKDGVGGVDGLNWALDVTLSADGKHAYVTGYGDHAVGWYERNASTGALTYGGMLKDGVGGVDGLGFASVVTLSADGKHAYVTGYGDHAVGWYERNASTGALTYGGMLKDGVGGVDGLSGAIGVTISTNGNHVYVTGEFDNAVSWFERNASTGALSYAQTGAIYTLTTADLGKTITVVASYTDGGTFDHNVSSGGTAAIQPIYTPSQPNHFVDLNSTVGLEMIWVEPGTFTMGSPLTEVGRGTFETEHNVTLTKGFYLGKYEVTQAQYEAIMDGVTGDLNATPSHFYGNPNRPVEKVNWEDIQIFLSRLNASEQAAGRLPAGWSYVLPTESQWEYACRAGTTTAYWWGATIGASNANYGGGLNQSKDVGQYPANPWGFFDMHGNVSERVADRLGYYPTGNPVVDPIGNSSTGGWPLLVRGGHWIHHGSLLRSACRDINNGGTTRGFYLGFRLAFRQNFAPTDLNSTTPLTIAENQPIGTLVGEFNATDPDANASLTYHLVSGAGDGNNSLFILDANGTLRTATTFDYEANASTYSIRVQAKDEHNATVEKVFTVTLQDWFDGSWRKLTSPVLQQHERFGSSVSQSGDLLTVGAYGSNTNGINASGAAYLFRVEQNGSMTLIDKLSAYDPSDSSFFGVSVSQSGNLTGVGAVYEDPNGILNAGATYLYRLENNGSTSFLTKFTAPDMSPSQLFGNSVTVSGDQIAVGTLLGTGAYLYKLENNGTVSFLHKPSPPNGVHEGEGGSVAQSGNLTLVGAHLASVNGQSIAGAAYLYRLEHNGSLSLLHRITAPDPTVGDLFGSNVSQFGNLIVIGSPGSDPNGISQGGAAYLYRLEANGSLTHLHKITVPDAAENDQFGGHLGNSSIAQYDNLIAIGATNADPNGVNGAGAVYLYRFEDNGSVSFLQKLIAPRGHEIGVFGKSISLFERTLTIGTDGEDINGVANAGAVYVFDIAELTNRSPTGIVTITGIAEVGQTLTADVSNLADADGLGSITYQWFRDGITIGGASSSTYSVTQADLGYAITVTVSYTDGGTTAESVSSMPAVSAVADSDSMFYVKTDGSLWGMGSNSDGQLGDGTTLDRNTSVRIVPSGVTQVASHSNFTLFVKEDGSLWGMGSNAFGQLGLPAASYVTPQLIVPFGVNNVSTGSGHTLFIKDDGSLWAMGANDFGQLGDGTNLNRATPVQVIASGVKQVASFHKHSVVVMKDGSLWTTGHNLFGQLGDGSTTHSNVFKKVMNSGVVRAAAGSYHTLAVKDDHRLWGFGRNYFGQLGPLASHPQVVPLDLNVTSAIPFWADPQILASGGAGHSVIGGKHVRTFGRNNYGQRGVDPNGVIFNEPAGFVMESNATQVAAGFYNSYYLLKDGSLWGVGRNASGQLGDGTTADRNVPVQIATGVFQLANVSVRYPYGKKITAPDPGPAAHFGFSVSQNNDLLVVGAYEADPGGVTDAGAVYLYREDANDSVNLLQKVIAPDGAAGDRFGYSVNLNNSLLAVGSDRVDIGDNNDTGATYLYRVENNGSVSFLQKLIPPDANASFGCSLSQSGDLLAVGAESAKAVYLYRVESNGTATFLQKVISPASPANDRFGLSVSQAGDLLVVGATSSDLNGMTHAGAVYVFRVESNNTVTFLDKVIATSPATQDNFGWSISLSQDQLAVSGYPTTDAVHLFRIEDNGTTTFLQKVTFPEPGWQHAFGASISLRKDLLAIGATQVSLEGKSLAGATYIYRIETNGTASFLQKVVASDVRNNTNYGWPVVLSKDYLFVGAMSSAVGANNAAGAVYRYDIGRIANRPPTDLNAVASLTIAENQPIGSIVGEFNATDLDVNSTLTYHLVSGAGDGNNSLFTLETNGTLKTAITFDYESNASTYSIRVRGIDQHNDSVEGNFTVTLTDVFENQAPGAISIQFASLTENQPVGTVVGKLNAVDPEAGVVRYSLVNGLGAMGNKFFTVDLTGVLRTAVVFDFEQNASYSIRARAMDEFNASREEVLNIQVSNQWEDPDGDGLENSYDPDDDNDGFSDIVEIVYGSDPLDPNSLPNRAPSEISLSPDRVEENMPVGTMVGQLRTIDFDDPNGTGVYQYSLLSGGQDDGIFTVDQNGTLQTRVVLDFERASFHTVVLRVTDHFGAFLDENITIQVVDTFAPIVETGDPVDVGFQEAMLSGKLLDKGSSMDLIQIGMLVSTDPNPYLDTNGVILERGFLDTNQTFEAMMMGLEKGTKYFYRTYAMNAEGVGYGVVKDFVAQEHARGPSWVNAQPGAAANWWTSRWFGSFYMNDGNAWIMHSELGWLYPMGSGKNGVWLWKDFMGWLWTDEQLYPFLYQNESASWLYFYGASEGTQLFYRYRDERWIEQFSGNNSN